MTLEDFFTLSEMKDGLTVPARVKELVNVMQNERDCMVKNVGDLTRQRATVASTIVATDDKECLDIFIKLDGIGFIDRWLKDAENCIGDDTSHSFVEESMAALLCALVKLNIDSEKAKSCGIWLTVKNLLDHNSNKVQNKAKALFDSWKEDGNSVPVLQDVEKGKAPGTDLKQVDLDLVARTEDAGGSTKESSVPEGDTNEEKHVEPSEGEIVPSSNSGVHPPEGSVDVQMQESDKPTALDHEGTKEDCALKPVMLDPVKESLSSTEQSPGFQVDETKPIGSCTPTIPENGFEGKANVPEPNEFLGKSEEEQPTILPSHLGSMSISSVSTPVDPNCGSSDCAADARQSVTGTELQNEKQNSSRGSPSCDMDMAMAMPEEKNEKRNSGSPDNCISTMVAATGSHHSGSDTSSSTGDSGTSSGEKENGSDETEELPNYPNFPKTATQAKDLDVDKRSSFAELDYGMVDALEVARQVAIEVEREVTGCGDPSGSSSERTSDGAPEVATQVAIEVERKEPSGSSSERISDIAMRQPESAESVTVQEIQSIKAASKDGPLSSKTSAKRVELSSTINDLDAERENHRLQDLESSQVTEAAQDPEASMGRGLGKFDLNQEMSSDDMDHHHLHARRASTPISVVSASRASAAAAPRFPVAPLQFGGALGWKGSAATSAFRPTSSARKISEGEKRLVIEESSSSSKQRDDCLDFDLNVAENGDEPINLIPKGKTNLAFSGLPFQNSSIQVGSGRSERLKLDLNLASDDVDTPADSMVEKRLVQHRNSHFNLSPSSSSSSMQPSLKNFDLNDQPSLFNDPSDLQPSRGKSSLNAVNSVISIMGTKVEVNRKDSVPYMSSLPNGNSAFDASYGRNVGVSGMGSAVQYGHPHLFGYNGLAAGPGVTLSSSMYGPAGHGHVQYMVDSRGVPVVPQLMGSGPASLAAYARPPFVMGMIGGMPPGLNGPGPSQHNFDLSSGMMIDEGNRQPGVLRQLLDPGQARSAADEHLRVNTQSFLGPSGLGKRKEPEDGWEPYPHYRNHRHPPWN